MDPLFSFLGGFGQEIALVYGEAGSGKTTLALQGALEVLKKEKKVLFLDTETGFSTDRFQQMGGQEFLDHLIVMNVKDFTQQGERISWLVDHAGQFGLIIVDTIGHFYRHEVKKNKSINYQMDRQLRLLFEISKQVPVLLTNQVYGKMDSTGVASVGGKMVLKWCQKIIELQRKPRILKLLKPEEKAHSFTIVDRGLLL
jgi:DNA repair protein RadB